MTSAGRCQRLLLLMVTAMIGRRCHVAGLACYTCTSSNNSNPACADPFNPRGNGIGRCIHAGSSCVAARMIAGSLGKQLLELLRLPELASVSYLSATSFHTFHNDLQEAAIVCQYTRTRKLVM